MNALLRANVSELWSLAGWTMVHFLWLGAIVAGVAAVARIALRSVSSNIRYAIAIGSLIALAALPPATAMWLLKNLSPTQIFTAKSPAAAAQISAPIATASAPGSAGGGLTSVAELPTTSALPPLSNPRQSRGLPAMTAPEQTSASPTPFNELLESCVTYLPWLWLIGTPLTFALLVSGVVGTRRLGRSSRAIDSDPIVELLAHLAASLRITRRVTIAVCDRIASPVLIGIIRPMILLPPAAVTGWSPDELEMVLLHELAHVRRWDNLVNLLQRCVESLLFFHPAVWLISGWARHEREACCDATVVARTNRPHAYAELLVALAAQLPRSVLFHPAASSAMSAGPLRSRIQQILKLEEDPMLVSGKSLILMLGGFFIATALTVAYLPTGRAEEPGTKPPRANEADANTDGKTENADRIQKGNRALAEIETAFHVTDPDKARGYQNFAVESSRNDLFHWAYTVTDSNPVETRIYEASVLKTQALQHEMPAHGCIWMIGYNDDGTLLITATRRAHQIFCARLYSEGADGKLPKLAPKEYTARMYHQWLTLQKQPIGGLESYDASPHVAESEKDGASKPSAKFPSLEEQKLADLAYKRLGLELIPIGEDDLKRVKALGYEGGVQVIGLTGASQVRYGDILVGLHVWPTKDLKDVVAVIERKDLAELNPLKFYVVRTDEQAPNGMVASGRLPVQLLPAPSAAFTDPGLNANPQIQLVESQFHNPYGQGAPGPSNGPFRDVFDQASPASAAGPYTTPGLAPIPGITPANAVPVQVQVIESSKSGDSETTKLVSKPIAIALHNSDHFVMFFYSSDAADDLNLKAFQEQLKQLKKEFKPGPFSFAAGVVDVKNDKAVPQLYNIRSVPSYIVFWKGQQKVTLSGLQKNAQLLTALQLRPDIAPANSQPAVTSPAASYAIVPTPLTDSQSVMPSGSLNLFTASAQRLEEAVQRKSEAMEKRLAANSDEEVEKAKRDLDSANKHLEESKQQFEDAKRRREKLDTEDNLKRMYKQQVSSLPASWPAAPTRADSTWSQSVQPVRADETSTPEQILTAPTSLSATVNWPEKVDSSRIVASQPNPYGAPSLQANPKDTPTPDTHPNPSIEARRDDNSPAGRSSRSTRTDTSRSRSSRQATTNASEAQADDRIVVAYDIPAELMVDVKVTRDFPTENHGEFGSGGRYFLQATSERQKQFQQLLDATPKWRDPEAAKARAKQVYVKTEKDGQEYLEWQPAGLTFTSASNPKFEHANPSSWRGVIVADVAPGSPGNWNGIEPGDIMTKLGSFETKSLSELESLLKTQANDYSTKTVHCTIFRFSRRGGSGQLPGTLNLATDRTQQKPSAPTDDIAAVQPRTTIADHANPPSSVAIADKSALHYDDKTFDDWRNMLTNELSTEKRTQAIRAIATFGRAGYAKEASEAILDIAGEYDFYYMEGDANPEGKLKDFVVGALAPDSRTQNLAKYWVPDLVGRLAKDPQKWKWLTSRLLANLKTEDATTIAALEPVTKNPDADLRSVALRAIVTSDHLSKSGKLNDKTQQLLTAALQSKNPTEVHAALNSLVYTPPNGGSQSEFNPALATLVFDANGDVQLAARNVLKYLPNEDAAKLVDKYVAVLKDESRKADRVAAIRALSALGTAATTTVAELEGVLYDMPQDLPSRVAAAFAIDRIEGGNRAQNMLQTTADAKTKDRVIKLMNKEQQLQNR